MRFGLLRRVALAIALTFLTASATTVLADGFGHTIPPEVMAYDIHTGGPYMAPPIPWGHYAKSGLFDSYHGKGCILHSLCLGKGCKGCGGMGCNGIGHGLFGGGSGGKCGHGLFNHCGGGGGGGKCGHGLLNHCGGGFGGGLVSDGCGNAGCGGGHGRRIKDCGLCKNKGCGFCKSSGSGDPIYALASAQAPTKVAPAPLVTSQMAPNASPQCSDPACGMSKGHHGDHGIICDGCSGKGCGKCGGHGLLKGHGMSGACDYCGGQGCGKCGGLGGLLGGGCGFCGGKGCGKCGLSGLGGGIHGKVSSLLHPHRGKIKYFVGPGGPVPLTPGYVPYIVTTRSPRDFLAFPPYTPSNP